MTITLSVLDEPRSDVQRLSFRSQPRPSDGAMSVVDDHAAVGRDLLAPLGRILVHAARIHAGNASSMSPAGRVSPRSPERLEVGRIEAARRGAVIDWAVGDPEAIPYASQSFDSVVSCLGVMFERHHQTVANELLRVTTLGAGSDC